MSPVRCVLTRATTEFIPCHLVNVRQLILILVSEILVVDLGATDVVIIDSPSWLTCLTFADTAAARFLAVSLIIGHSRPLRVCTYLLISNHEERCQVDNSRIIREVWIRYIVWLMKP